MFGYTIIKKDELEELEEDLARVERHNDVYRRRLDKTVTLLKHVRDNSKRMNKNDIVKMCLDLLKELR